MSYGSYDMVIFMNYLAGDIDSSNAIFIQLK